MPQPETIGKTMEVDDSHRKNWSLCGTSYLGAVHENLMTKGNRERVGLSSHFVIDLLFRVVPYLRASNDGFEVFEVPTSFSMPKF